MEVNRNTKAIIAIVAAAVVLLIGVFWLTGRHSGSPSTVDAPAATKFYSPLTKTSDNLVINYGGSADPNVDAVMTQYRFFGLDALPLSKTAKAQLPNILPGYLEEYLQPTLQYTYIHIIKDTIKQTSDTAYSFDFYVDSSETYFHFALTDSAGTNIGNPVTEIPWEGTE